VKHIGDHMVEFTDEEALVHEIHEMLMDRGYSQGQALTMLLGTDVPPGLRGNTPRLNKVMTPDFVAYLAR
jgi:hypothetical protein